MCRNLEIGSPCELLRIVVHFYVLWMGLQFIIIIYFFHSKRVAVAQW